MSDGNHREQSRSDVQMPLMPALKLGAMSVLEAEQVLLDMLKKKAELERRIPEVASFINANRPINRLPVEILVTIFDLVHSGLPYMLCIARENFPREPPWYPMIAVCRLWRDIVSSTPKLWWLVHVVPEISAEVLKSVLCKSGNCPIDVIMEGIEDDDSPTETMMDHSSRIATLHIQDVDRTQADALLGLVHQHMPTLTELRIWLDPWTTDLDGEGESEAEVFMLDIQANNHPKLSTLSLRGVGLDCLDDGSVPFLTELFADYIGRSVSLWPVLLLRRGRLSIGTEMTLSEGTQSTIYIFNTRRPATQPSLKHTFICSTAQPVLRKERSKYLW